MGFLGRGQPAPPHLLGGLRERCKLSQRGPGRSPGCRRVFLYSEPSDCLSQHLRTCCIQFAWLYVLGFSRGDIHINIPHINSWGVRSPAYPRFRRLCLRKLTPHAEKTTLSKAFEERASSRGSVDSVASSESGFNSHWYQ